MAWEATSPPWPFRFLYHTYGILDENILRIFASLQVCRNAARSVGLEEKHTFVGLRKMFGRDVKTAIMRPKMRAIYALYMHHIRTIYAQYTLQTRF